MTLQPLQPLGDPDAAVCADDSCLLPGAGLTGAGLTGAEVELQDREPAEVEPGAVGRLDDAQQD